MIDRAAMIVLNVKLEFRSFIFQNDKLISSSMMKFPPQPYVVFTFENLYTYAACFTLSLVKIVVTLVELFSCFLDQDHVHTSTAMSYPSKSRR